MNKERQPDAGRKTDIIAVVAIGLLIVSFSLLYGLFMQKQTTRPGDGATGLDPADAQAIVTRGSALLDLAEPPGIWAGQLSNGRTGLADYLLRVLVSRQYLSKQPDDRQFIIDLQAIVTGSALSDADLLKKEASLTRSGSRLALINELLADAGYGSRLTAVQSVSGIELMAVENALPQNESEVIGRLPVQVKVRSTGQTTVLHLYANGLICDSQVVSVETPSSDQIHRLEWDTDLTGSGMHHLAVLALGSDGRGFWTPLADYHVPVINDLPAGAVLIRNETAWFRAEPWQNGTIRLNITQTDTPLVAELYSDSNTLLAQSVSAPGQPGALAAQTGSEKPEDRRFYLRIRTEGEAQTGAPAQYTLVAAPLAAQLVEQPGEWLAVIGQNQDTLDVRDAAGQVSAVARDSVSLIDPQARLSTLSIAVTGLDKVAFAPAFDRETTLYALYVPTNVSQVFLNATAMEGSAATVSLFVEREGEPQTSIDPDAALSLDYSVNKITVAVRGFDGADRAYLIYILRPPDTEGFSRILNPFPVEWRTPLYLLHVQYPSWRFEADVTGIDWQTFLDAQDQRDFSLIDAAHVPASWVEADSPVYDGSSWKAAERQVIAYYADPRNFLDPVNIFQYEKLTYVPELHTRTAIEQVLQNSFMEQNQSEIDYAGLIDAAGKDADISPFFIASRIIQEMGRQGQSPLASGTLDGYTGVYNFYNIGATPNPDVPDGARINGARFALFGRDPDQAEITPEEADWLLPWTTPQRAITGGARWIAGRYVAIGQDTLYGQKFDLVDADGLFIHQYAQNIQMAWAEGRRTYQAWLDLGLLQESFTFKIPVFEHMPDTPASLP